MLIYHYDKDGVFLNSTTAAPCPAMPLDEQGNARIILPARAATNAPPTAGTKQVAKVKSVDAETDQIRGVTWELVADYRGDTIYSTRDQTSLLVTELGALPDGYTLLPPPGKNYVWSGAAWEPDMAALIVAAKEQVDSLAEQKRQAILTAGVGMQAAYERKETEARAYLLDPAPEDAKYPYLAAEVGITAPTMRGVAEIIVKAAEAWWGYGAAIETVRLQAKKDLATATTTGEIEAILNALSWPSVPE